MIKSELKAIINRYTHRVHDDGDLNDIIDRVGIAIGRDAELFEQDKSVDVAITDAGLAPSDIAADFLVETSISHQDGSNDRYLRYYTPDQSSPVFWSAAHTPTGYTWKGGRLYILPHSDVTLTVLYKQRIPVLASDGATNDVLTAWPNTYVYGCVLEAGNQFEDDDVVAKFKPLYDEELAKLAAFAEAQRLGAYTQIRSL